MIENIKMAINASRFWLFANGLGICAYLFFEFLMLIPHSEMESPNAFDLIHAWLVIELPIVSGFLVANLIWLIFILKNKRIVGNLQSLPIWVSVVLAWGCALFAYGMGAGMLKVLIMMVDRGAWK